MLLAAQPLASAPLASSGIVSINVSASGSFATTTATTQSGSATGTASGSGLGSTATVSAPSTTGSGSSTTSGASNTVLISASSGSSTGTAYISGLLQTATVSAPSTIGSVGEANTNTQQFSTNSISAINVEGIGSSDVTVQLNSVSISSLNVQLSIGSNPFVAFGQVGLEAGNVEISASAVAYGNSRVLSLASMSGSSSGDGRAYNAYYQANYQIDIGPIYVNYESDANALGAGNTFGGQAAEMQVSAGVNISGLFGTILITSLVGEGSTDVNPSVGFPNSILSEAPSFSLRVDVNAANHFETATIYSPTVVTIGSSGATAGLNAVNVQPLNLAGSAGGNAEGLVETASLVSLGGFATPYAFGNGSLSSVTLSSPGASYTADGNISATCGQTTIATTSGRATGDAQVSSLLTVAAVSTPNSTATGSSFANVVFQPIPAQKIEAVCSAGASVTGRADQINILSLAVYAQGYGLAFVNFGYSQAFAFAGTAEDTFIRIPGYISVSEIILGSCEANAIILGSCEINEIILGSCEVDEIVLVGCEINEIILGSCEVSELILW